MAVMLAATTAGLWAWDPSASGIDPVKWAAVREAVVVMLGLFAASLLLRPFLAILVGLQETVFGGWVAMGQATLTVVLTIGLVLYGGFGLTGLAIAAALPPFLGGLAAAGRVVLAHRYALHLPRPSLIGSWHLVREGFGLWLAGLGVRLLMAAPA